MVVLELTDRKTTVHGFLSFLFLSLSTNKSLKRKACFPPYPLNSKCTTEKINVVLFNGLFVSHLSMPRVRQEAIAK